MAGHVEVNPNTELARIINERKRGIDDPEHVTMIAGFVFSERLRMTNFIETQGDHGGQLTLLQHTVEVVDSRVDRLHGRVDRLDAKVDGLDRKVDGLQAEMRQGFENVSGRFERLEGRFDGLEGRFDGLEGRFDGLEGRFDGLEHRIVEAVGKQLKEHSETVLKGVAGQLEAHMVPVTEAERRGYRP
jgi:predicted nuclease with TOPRIM domain